MSVSQASLGCAPGSMYLYVCGHMYVHGDDVCSCICGELVCVISCDIGVVMSRVG